MEIEGISQQSQKLSKTEKKLRQKQMKARYTLLKHEGIECVSYPTKNLVIANGGLGNGVSRCQLRSVVEESGLVEALLMPPKKPYAFVKYTTAEDSKRAYDSLNGKEILMEGSSQNVVLYFNFVEKVPWEDVTPVTLPPGLMVVEELVSPEEEKQLLDSIDWEEDEVISNAQKSLKHRRVKHFGYEFRYDNNNVDRDKPLPGGIPPHIDTHSAFEDEIICLSLGAKIVMDFKHPDGHAVAVVLPQCSLLVMSGEARYLWTHGITPRKFDIVQAAEGQKTGIVSADTGDLTLNKRERRTSFTFRKVRRSPCTCSYSSVCDSQSQGAGPSFLDDEGEAAKLEEKYVHEVYEEIATHFSSTRHSPWPRVVEFLGALPCGSIVADVGCGNGKYLGVSKDLCMCFLWLNANALIITPEIITGVNHQRQLRLNFSKTNIHGEDSHPSRKKAADHTTCHVTLKPACCHQFGCDRSKTLVDISGKRGFQAFVCDALSVPVRSGSCDACISIALIHHFSTEERRLASLAELVRLLRPGGRALIYVWAMEQEYNKQKSKYLKGEKASDGKAESIISDSLKGMGKSNYEGSGCPNRSRSQCNSQCCSATQSILAKLPVHTNRTSFNSQDLLVPWHLKDGSKKKAGHAEPQQPLAGSPKSHESTPVFHRYYHVFCEGELELMCKRIEGIKVQESYYDQGNWCVVLEKQ
ncbi:alkylated DNA repair protein alkB homolog 8 isoform X2 [Varanus komodoensis]|uniref:alkylated DNA repair protein alkB homolog 8 isoform X2 n=1 Tax=Varanus komodoensis TaxID=61221 RepID=UPI001CF7E6E1|nr:alkylated DNA repair protein alkB homolog 8 isoform X2 [Varanus komodoensis]